MKLKRLGDAVAAFQGAIEAAMTQLDDEAKLKPFVTDAEKCLKICKGQSTSSKSAADFFKDECKLPMLTGANPQMPSVSKSVKIVYSSKNGRHGIATRKIGCGEVILLEDSNFKFASLDKRGRVCTHCLGLTLDMIPSPLNTKVGTANLQSETNNKTRLKR